MHKLIFLAILIFTIISLSKEKENDELKLVIQIMRHGAREPIWNTWKPYVSKDPGELTSTGIRQQYDLGQLLRTQYIKDKKFLSNNFNPEEIYIRSTEYPRAIQSAQSLLHGLYSETFPPLFSENITKIREFDLNKVFQSENNTNKLFKKKKNTIYPINQTLRANETLLMSYLPNVCQGVKYLSLLNIENPFFQEFQEQFNETYQRVKNIFHPNGTSSSVSQIFQIFDNYESYLQSNQSIPSLDEKTYREMYYVYWVVPNFLYFGLEIQKRLAATKLFEEFIEHIDKKISDQSKRKFILYSAHDFTLISLLNAFNITSYECIYDHYKNKGKSSDQCSIFYPTYASVIILELFKNKKNEYYVKIKYQGKYVKLKNKDLKIGWDELKKKMENYQLPNFQEVCQGKKFPKITPEQDNKIKTQGIANCFLTKN